MSCLWLKMKTPYRFTSADIAEIARTMRKVKRNDSPAEERRAIAYAIALMERQVGAAIGINDKAGMQWSASGDATQEDCVDDSTNTTSFLMVLQSNGLLRYHTVQGTIRRGQYALWHADWEAGQVLAPLHGDNQGDENRSALGRRRVDRRHRYESLDH